MNKFNQLLLYRYLLALFRVEFSGRGELSERQQKLGQHLSHLIRIAEEFNIAVVVINQCMADPGALSMFGPVVKPVGGKISLLTLSICSFFLYKNDVQNIILTC